MPWGGKLDEAGGNVLITFLDCWFRIANLSPTISLQSPVHRRIDEHKRIPKT